MGRKAHVGLHLSHCRIAAFAAVAVHHRHRRLGGLYPWVSLGEGFLFLNFFFLTYNNHPEGKGRGLGGMGLVGGYPFDAG